MISIVGPCEGISNNLGEMAEMNGMNEIVFSLRSTDVTRSAEVTM